MHLHFFMGALPCGVKGSRIIISAPRKPQDGPRHPFRGADSPPSFPRAEPLPPVRRKPRRRQREPRPYEPDAEIRGEDLPEPAGEPLQGELREAVRKIAGPKVPGVRVPEEHDAGSRGASQQRKEGAGQERRPPEVHRENGVPLPGGEGGERRPREDGSVVDQEIQPPPEFPEAVREGMERRRAGKIQPERGPAGFPGDRRRLAPRGAVRQDDLVAGRAEGAGDRRADPPAAAGDQRNLPPPGGHPIWTNLSRKAPQIGQVSGGSSPWWM